MDARERDVNLTPEALEAEREEFRLHVEAWSIAERDGEVVHVPEEEARIIAVLSKRTATPSWLTACRPTSTATSCPSPTPRRSSASSVPGLTGFASGLVSLRIFRRGADCCARSEPPTAMRKRR